MDHGVIFVLAHAVVGEERKNIYCFIVFQKMMEQADHAVRPFADVLGLINEVISLDLCPLVVDSKHRALPSSFKIRGTNLLRAAGVVHVLCKIEG